jgi:thiamine biosynthesis lipoprotein
MLLIAGLLLYRPAAAQQDALDRHVYRQIHMGMEVRIVLYAAHDTTVQRAAKAAFQRIAMLDSTVSSYRRSSELNRLNTRSGGPPFPVSAPLFTVLQRAQQLARQSDGAFDVTVGPSVALWRRARETGQLPDEAALQDADARTGWRKIQLNETRQTVRLRADSMQLNLGGLAKGYILDQALATLSDEGVTRALIEAGGDMVMSGPPPGTDGWRIQLPGAGPEGTARTTRLSHAAVSTSGDTQQFVEIDGTRYSHVIDPRTGLGLTHRLLVTIIADDGMTADGLATTVGILGATAGRAFLAEHYLDATAYIRRADPDDAE